MRFFIQRGLIVMAMLLSSWSPAALAQMSQKSDSSREEWSVRMDKHMQELFDQLQLTDAQKNQLQENKLRNRQQMDVLRTQMRQLREQMRQELQKEELNMQSVNTLQSQMKDVQGKILDHRLAGILEVRKILTREQFQKFSDEMHKHRENFRKKMWGRSNDDVPREDSANGKE